ncbi:MAG: hypothetical protein QXS21_00985 [Thermoproteota archaeon]|nr:hypothetical protein [Candidatus Brockarchaeota archaeon]MBO3768327.1 hypothetical protein [Candidatus Brockarchaeota archaeon]MBO3800987.1 hypothetical protein [Candidatus Brockarchaeota archaeon]
MEKLEYLKNNDDNTPYIEEQALDPSIFSFNDFSSHYPLSQCYVNKKLHRYVHLLLEKLNLPLSMDTAIIKTYLRIKKSSSKTSINSMALLVSLVVLYSKFYNYPTSINEVIKIVRDFDPKIKKRHVLKYMFLIKSTNTVFNKILQPISFIDTIMNRLEDMGLIFVIPVSQKINYKKSLILISNYFLNELKGKAIGSNPRSIAACSIYASNLLIVKYKAFKCKRLTQKHLAVASNLAEYTVRENYEKYFSSFVRNPPEDLLLHLSLLLSKT